MTAGESVLQWPSRPYKGLSYYGPADGLLFAGRDADVNQCARIIANPLMRIVILHGGTGCGKSSFLRAGLIPYIESRGRGFRFLTHEDERAIFIRSTAEPLATLSEEMAKFISRERRVQTPAGEHVVRISVDDWRQSDDPSLQLVRALEEIAKAVPETLIVVVDQAEQVLTLNAGAEGREKRESFFRFVAEFSRSTFDLKLLIAIRTEYYGRYRTAIQESQGEMSAIADFYLDELSDSELTAAIKRPTLDTDIEGLGSPREQYNFVFEDGLPEKIVRDLRKAQPTGGILPVTQIVCDALYDLIEKRPGKPRVILETDYTTLGTLEDQVDRYLETVLGKWCGVNEVRQRQRQREIDIWKTILSELARNQVDGTVTTELKPSSELESVAVKSGSRLPFDETMAYLENEEQRIVRRVEVATLTNPEPVVCYSLGHDVLGLPLMSWRRDLTRFDAIAAVMRAVLFLIGAAALVGPALKAIAVLRGQDQTFFDLDTSILMFYGIVFLVGSFASRFALEETLMLYARFFWPLLPERYRESLRSSRRFARYLRPLSFPFLPRSLRSHAERLAEHTLTTSKRTIPPE